MSTTSQITDSAKLAHPVFKDHPLAAAFPLMDEREMNGSVADIKANGLALRIVLHEGKILDGRNRYRACKVAGIQPKTRDFKGGDALAFVISRNFHRRHLTVSQRAAVSAELANLRKGDVPSQKGGVLNQTPLSLADSAKLMNVGRATAALAKKIRKEDPEAFEALKAGELSLQEAKKKRNASISQRGEAHLESDSNSNDGTGKSQSSMNVAQIAADEAIEALKSIPIEHPGRLEALQAVCKFITGALQAEEQG